MLPNSSSGRVQSNSAAQPRPAQEQAATSGGRLPFPSDYGTIGQQQPTQWKETNSQSEVIISKRQQGKFGNVELFGMVVIPSIVFFLVCLLFSTHPFYTFRVVFTGFLLVLLLGAVLEMWKRQNEVYRFYFYVALLSCAAIIAGIFVGYTTFRSCFQRYWLYDASSVYTNVLPSTPTGVYFDAGFLIFADEAKLDISRSIGYRNVSRYCVAPIIDDDVGATIEFWAIGLDCCGSRGTFECDDASDRNARTGIVVADPDGYFEGDREAFVAAVRQAEAASKLTSAAEPIFVRWILDFEEAQRNLWIVGFITLVVSFVAMIILLSIVVGLLQTNYSAFGINRK